MHEARGHIVSKLTDEVIDKVDFTIALACKGRRAISGRAAAMSSSRILPKRLRNLGSLRRATGRIDPTKVGWLREITGIALLRRVRRSGN